MSAKAEEAGSAVLRRAVIGEFLAAHKNDVRNRSQALDIINDSGAAPESDNSRERRTNARNTALSFERFHQCRLFANFIGAGAGVPIAIELLARAEDVVAEKALGIGIINRLLHDSEQIAILAADVDVSLLRADGESGDDHAFDNRVGVLLEDQAVFAGARLGFVAIHQNVFRFGGFFRNEAPLHSGREAGAAASAKVGSLHLVDDRVGRHLQGFLHGLIAIELEVSLDVSGTFAKALGNDA